MKISNFDNAMQIRPSSSSEQELIPIGNKADLYSTDNNKNLWIADKDWQELESGYEMVFSQRAKLTHGDEAWRLSFEGYFGLQITFCLVAHF